MIKRILSFFTNRTIELMLLTLILIYNFFLWEIEFYDSFAMTTNWLLWCTFFLKLFNRFIDKHIFIKIAASILFSFVFGAIIFLTYSLGYYVESGGILFEEFGWFIKSYYHYLRLTYDVVFWSSFIPLLLICAIVIWIKAKIKFSIIGFLSGYLFESQEDKDELQDKINWYLCRKESLNEYCQTMPLTTENKLKLLYYIETEREDPYLLNLYLQLFGSDMTEEERVAFTNKYIQKTNHNTNHNTREGQDEN